MSAAPATAGGSGLHRLAPFAAAAVVGLVHVVAATRMTAPIIMADEYGYLGAARYLVGDAPQTQVPYHPGAGLLYVPAALAGGDPLGTYHAALVTNGLLGALLALAAWWVAGSFEPLRPLPVRFAATCAVGLYTSFTGYAALAGPEVPFAALELALVGVVAHAIARRSPAWWGLAGAGAAAAWALHPRGAGVVIAALVVGAVALRPFRARIAEVAALAVPILVGVPLASWLNSHVSGTVLDPEQYDSGAVLDGLFTGTGLHRAVITLFGQAFYLCAATLGLVIVGAVALHGRWRSARDVTALFPLLAFALVFAISVATNARASRADHLLYGRYNEGAIAPLLLAGMAVLVATNAAGQARRYVAVAGGVTLVTAGAFYVLAGSARLHGLYYLVTVLGIDPVRRRIGWPDPLLLAAAAFTLIWLVAASRRFGRLVPIAFVTLVFLAFAVKNTRDFFQPESRTRATQRVLATQLAVLDRVQPIDCVAYDGDHASTFHFPNYRYFFPARYVVFRGAEPPCGDVVISSRTYGATHPSATLVAVENGPEDQALWVLR